MCPRAILESERRTPGARARSQNRGTARRALARDL